MNESEIMDFLKTLTPRTLTAESECLQDLLTLAVHLGIRLGQTERDHSYNEAFRNYTEVTITN